ncbi:MAG: hypothetical protein CVT95_07365 [Bacteroidetes bacterium HGW-Bacteroidetes-12]|jgi:hypothetical protein|nr:MAG: hypothetical protein CVT95_07365 [Bacteroidetes bacterium HGW-Bacteroidetes-12]
MIKDIQPEPVKNVAIAVVEEFNELNQPNWNVYIVNLKEITLENVLISSKGYLKLDDGSEKKTSLLRHSLGNIAPKSFVKIEPIIEEVFGLHNEYWLSYFSNNQLLDKKYIFLAETIKKENFTTIPLLNKKGVMIG